MNTEIVLAPPQQAAWIAMAIRKNELTTRLTQFEMDLQGILLNKPVEQLPMQLKVYREKFAEMKALRLEFTNAIDAGIVQPLMQYEKRSDPKTNTEYISADARELAARQEATRKLQADQMKATEIGQFKAYFSNEYTRIVADVRLAYARIISEAYQHALTARTPVSAIDSVIQIAISACGDVKPGDIKKFVRTYIPDDEALALFKSIRVPDWPSYMRDAIADCNEKFSLYANDLANAEQAVAAEALTYSAIVIETDAELQQEMAATTLIAQAEAFVLPEPGFKSVVETTRIKIIDDNPKWVLLITTAFVQHFQNAFTKLRVKKYSALTVEQMAKALDALVPAIKVDGVEYENIVK